MAKFQGDRSRDLGDFALKKKRVPKTCKNSGNFLPLQILIANISGTGQDIENRKDMSSRAVPSAFDEKGPVNFGPLPTENSM